MQTKQKELFKKVESQEAGLINSLLETYRSQFTTINGVQFLGTRISLKSSDHLKKLAQLLGATQPNTLVVLVNEVDGKAAVAIAINESLSNEKNWQAPQIIKEKIAPLIKGGGGGQKTLATAGGQDATQLDKVIEAVKGML